MNAAPVLLSIARALKDTKLEVILIGNAAAALHGAPVTTLDFDFMFRDTPSNRRKLKSLAKRLKAVVLRPYYPVSSLFRVMSDDSALQLDFLPHIHGIRSFEALRSRAVDVQLGDAILRVASLEDIIRSKRSAGRLRDLAVLPVLKATLDESKKTK
jgi:hypothetical protein